MARQAVKGSEVGALEGTRINIELTTLRKEIDELIRVHEPIPAKIWPTPIFMNPGDTLSHYRIDSLLGGRLVLASLVSGCAMAAFASIQTVDIRAATPDVPGAIHLQPCDVPGVAGGGRTIADIKGVVSG